MAGSVHRGDPGSTPGGAFRLGQLQIDMPAVQAALSGYSDPAMRLVAREHGAPYALHEVVLDTTVLQKGKLQRRILDLAPEDHPVGGQLMGSLPDQFGAAARALVRGGYDVVDINFGCPVNKVLGRRRGGYLLQDPATALRMVDAVLQEVGGEVPVTVKMRRGYDDTEAAERNFFTILEGVISRGVAAITLHPRTVAQKYVGSSRWEFLRRCKQQVGNFTLLGSGDLFTPFAVLQMLRATGVDGVTVARGCIGNPFFFRQLRDLLAGRPARWPRAAEQRAAIWRHWQLAVPYYGGEAAALPHVRMHVIKYAQHHPQPVWARERCVLLRRPDELPALLEQVFDDRFDAERPAELQPDALPASDLQSCGD